MCKQQLSSDLENNGMYNKLSFNFKNYLDKSYFHYQLDDLNKLKINIKLNYNNWITEIINCM